MPKPNNYRNTIIQLQAQLDIALAYLAQSSPDFDWVGCIQSEATERLTPDYCQARVTEFRQKKVANLKPGYGRKPAKPVVINGKLTTYKQAAEEAGVSVSAIHNRIKAQKLKEEQQCHLPNPSSSN